MIVLPFICVLILGLVSDALFVSIKIRINERLPEDRRLSWWWRDYRQVNRVYRE